MPKHLGNHISPLKDILLSFLDLKTNNLKSGLYRIDILLTLAVYNDTWLTYRKIILDSDPIFY